MRDRAERASGRPVGLRFIRSVSRIANANGSATVKSMPQARPRTAMLLSAFIAATSTHCCAAGGMQARPLDLGAMPAPLALAASWDTELVGAVYAAAGARLAAEGAHLVAGPSLA